MKYNSAMAILKLACVKKSVQPTHSLAYRLEGNSLSNTIPSELGNLVLLQSLNLGYNCLTGPLPTNLGNLANLESMKLSENYLSGSLPSELANLTMMSDFRIQFNLFNGTVPLEFQNMDSFDYLFLHANDLTGDLNPTFCQGVTWLLNSYSADCASGANSSPEIICDCCISCCLSGSGSESAECCDQEDGSCEAGDVYRSCEF